MFTIINYYYLIRSYTFRTVYSSKPKGHAVVDRSHQQREQQTVDPGNRALAVAHMLQTGFAAQSRVARPSGRAGLLLRQAKSDYKARERVRERDGRTGHGVHLPLYRRVQAGKTHAAQGLSVLCAECFTRIY